MPDITTISPQPGRQTQFLSSSADIVIYGGSAGGGKTWALLLEPIRHVQNPEFGATIFRRTFPEITREGGMWEESQKIYPLLGAKPNRIEMLWRFPTGARISFAHLQYDSTVSAYQGAQIPLIGFDQLEHFSKYTFFYMLSRNRSVCGVKPYVRATCNPDPDSWLAEFLSWWIDPEDGYAILSRAGVVRYFVRIKDDFVWGNSPQELVERYPHLDPVTDIKSLTFIPATVYDNQILLRSDPTYLANLKLLDPVERDRLLGDPERGGNWKIRPSAGKVFNREWFLVVDEVPKTGVAIRFWDFASTERKALKDDPDYTAGVLMLASPATNVVGGYEFFVIDELDGQFNPGQVDDVFFETSKRDYELCKSRGWRYVIRWEEEPGSASHRESRRLVMMLPGKLGGPVDAKGIPSRSDKLVRAKPLISQSMIGNVKLLRGKWNDRWLSHMHNQPSAHDDIMDGSSGAYNELTTMLGRKKSGSHDG